MNNSAIKILAPAKVNLFLHVVGKREDGYHLLESLVGFSDIVDIITITPSNNFSLELTGPFSKDLNTQDNLITKAVESLSNYANKPPNMAICLTKNIPLGAGLGGGSANTAAIIKTLIDYWEIDISEFELKNFLVELGADVPICYVGKSSVMRGIGEEIEPCQIPNNLPALLIYPNVGSSTKAIFKDYDRQFSSELADIPSDLSDKKTFFEFIKKQKNDLSDAAIMSNQIIKDALKLLEIQNGCLCSRMSGSGSTCVGLFDHVDQADDAKEVIQNLHSDWWVETTLLNSI